MADDVDPVHGTAMAVIAAGTQPGIAAAASLFAVKVSHKYKIQHEKRNEVFKRRGYNFASVNDALEEIATIVRYDSFQGRQDWLGLVVSSDVSLDFGGSHIAGYH
ncbi:hypothetical protein, partial [Erythrobacter sp. YJ-T3-07]|uniref:hypothetical protein n=1 Tax=Erythrobacter sp. YJ-T3-07 TaxID=2793063 RepID=UPI001F276FC2